MYIYEIDYFLRHTKLFSCGHGSFLAPSGAGRAGGAACTPRRKCEFRPGSVPRALGVQRRKIWQVFAALLSYQLEPTRPMQTPKIPIYFHFSTSPCCRFWSTTAIKRLGSHGRTAAAAYNTSEPRKAHIHRNACVPPFQLAAPPGFQVNHIPKGNLK